MKRISLTMSLASAVAVAGTVLAPTAVHAGPALYFLECVAGSYVSEPMAITRRNVMGCAAGNLYRWNYEGGRPVVYNGLWCNQVGNNHPRWTGWEILVYCKTHVS